MRSILGFLTVGVALATPIAQDQPVSRPVPRPAYPPVYRPVYRPVASNLTVSSVPSNKTALVTDDISSCSSTWMAIPDVTIGGGTDRRTGFTTAVNKFCDMAHGTTVKSQDYLSMATEVFLNGGMDPSKYGLLGYVYCKRAHIGFHIQMRFQVGTNGVSYHAFGNSVPPKQDALNKLLPTTVLAAQSVNKGSGAPLNPWPLDSLNSVLPTSCHSHNDYDRDIPVFEALSAGCIGMEADVWLFNGDVILGHILPTLGRTFRAQYVNPLKAIIDHNGGSVYKSRPSQTLVLLVDFKTSDTGTLDAVVTALEPLRQAGYLSRLENGVFVKRAVTVVASGSAPFDRISTGNGVPGRDVFYDANLGALGGTTYTSQNSYVASADFQDVVGEAKTATLTSAQMNIITNHVNQAHAKGLVAGEYLWEALESLGVDLLNADDLSNTARVPRL